MLIKILTQLQHKCRFVFSMDKNTFERMTNILLHKGHNLGGRKPVSPLAEKFLTKMRPHFVEAEARLNI